MTEWNASAYDRLSNPMQSWGEMIVDRLALQGNETAMDLGCGSGRLTEVLLRKLPAGHVIAVDRSANMLEAARAHLEPEFDGRVTYLQRSLDELDLNEVAEVAFSNAAFHWVPDHPRLFNAIFAALKPGGRLIAQCGAAPNIARVRARAERLMGAEQYRRYFEGWTGPWEFATPELTAERLRSAGFEDIETSMFEAPVQLRSREETRDFFEHVIFGTHLERIPDATLRSQFVETMTELSAADQPPFRQDYWRLNLRARRPAD